MKPVKTFLSESNKIEGVYDQRSLEHALEAWDYLIQFDTLTEKNILETHRILMRTHITTGDGLGAYRRQDVMIGGRFGLDPIKIADAMHTWIFKANRVIRVETRSIEDLHRACEKAYKEQHIMFECIHPFIDGNGRMGRILMNWQRDKAGLPLLVIWEKEKYEYYKWFE